MTDLNTPLSREEMATYLAFMDDSFQTNTDNMRNLCDTQSKVLNDAINKMSMGYNNTLTELSEILNVLVKGQKDLLSAINTLNNTACTKFGFINKTDIKNKVNTLFCSSWNEHKQSLWIKKVRGEIANLCLEENRIEGVVYKDIYSSMKQEGYDVDDLLREYKSVNSKADIVSMIAASDDLRDIFSNCITKCTNKTGSKKDIDISTSKYTNKKNCPSEMSKHIPDNVKKIVARLAPDGNPNVGTYRKAYSLLGIDKKAFIKETEEKIGLKHIVLGYAIGINPSMVIKLDHAISEYLKKNGGETR